MKLLLLPHFWCTDLAESVCGTAGWAPGAKIIRAAARVYHHQDLGEPVHVDGSPILRRCPWLSQSVGPEFVAPAPDARGYGPRFVSLRWRYLFAGSEWWGCHHDTRLVKQLRVVGEPRG